MGSMSSTFHSLYCFMLALAKPTRFLDFLKHDIPVNGFRPSHEVQDSFWKQSTLWAWGFYILGSFLEAIVLMLIITYLINSQGEQRGFDFLLNSTEDYIFSMKLAFLWTGIKILFFPVFLYIGNIIRFISIKMVSGLWDSKQIDADEVWEIIGVSNSSYSFFCVPFLGKLAGEWAHFILLYKALRWRLFWGRGKTILTIILPGLLFWGAIITSTLLILVSL